MVTQKLLSLFDRAISSVFRLEKWAIGDDDGTYRCTYFVDKGRTIGVIGVDGEMRVMMGYWAVHHHLEKGKLTKRVLVRKDLKEGERIATEAEIRQHISELLQKLDMRYHNVRLIGPKVLEVNR